MKRFVVFIFKDYYPNGGADDIKGFADNIDEIEGMLNNFIKNEADRADVSMNIFDTETGSIICRDDGNSFRVYNGGEDSVNFDAIETIKSIIDNL